MTTPTFRDQFDDRGATANLTQQGKSNPDARQTVRRGKENANEMP